MRLTDEQVDVLLRGIVRSRVKERDGMSYVETWDIRAMMNRVFGFCGWSLISTSPTTLVFERETTVGKTNPKPGYRVAYKAELELIVHLPEGDARYAGTAIGEAVMPDYKVADAHDMAAKSAESGALKRAATNLGDQFGLSLYKGTLDPVVRKVVGFTPGQTHDDEHTEPVSPTIGNSVPRAEPDETESSPDEEPESPTVEQQPLSAVPVDEGAGDSPPTSPAPPSPIDEALGPDPGPSPRPEGESEEDALKRRMEAVEKSVKGMSNRQKIAVNALCRGEGIKAWASPSDEELDKVLAIIAKVARGDTQ